MQIGQHLHTFLLSQKLFGFFFAIVKSIISRGHAIFMCHLLVRSSIPPSVPSAFRPFVGWSVHSPDGWSICPSNGWSVRHICRFRNLFSRRWDTLDGCTIYPVCLSEVYLFDDTTLRLVHFKSVNRICSIWASLYMRLILFSNYMRMISFVYVALLFCFWNAALVSSLLKICF